MMRLGSEGDLEMSNETFFRMLSIALLGAVALAFVPDSQADSAAAATSSADAYAQSAPIEIEIRSVQEVQDINAGRFNPATAGDLTSFATSQEATAVSAFTQ